MRCRGTILSWKDDQGFGFITPLGGGPQVFVHISSFSNRRRRPVGGERVTYLLTADAQDRARAEDVAFVGDPSAEVPSSIRGSRSLMLAVAFLIFVSAAVLSGKLPFAVLGLYLVASAVTSIAYASDKSAARADRWRTQESTLHILSLIGGWPGALAAQKLLRHKSRKQSFLIVFWTTVVLNCVALGWLFSPSGSATLHSILGAA